MMVKSEISDNNRPEFRDALVAEPALPDGTLPKNVITSEPGHPDHFHIRLKSKTPVHVAYTDSPSAAGALYSL
jgi:hypothetical protein